MSTPMIPLLAVVLVFILPLIIYKCRGRWNRKGFSNIEKLTLIFGNIILTESLWQPFIKNFSIINNFNDVNQHLELSFRIFVDEFLGIFIVISLVVVPYVLALIIAWGKKDKIEEVTGLCLE